MKSLLKNISWRSIRVWQRNFDVYLATWKVNFIPPLLEPLLYLLAFGLGLGKMIAFVPFMGEAVPYLKFIAPGLIATASMNHGFFETTYASFVRMYFQKTFDAILSTPLSIEDIVVGELLWGVTKSFFAACVIFLVCVSFGLLTFPQSLWMFPILIAGGLIFSGMGMCFTGVVKNIEMFNFPVFLLVTPMFLFAGVFFPLESLPVWAQKVAWALPLTFLVSSLRSLALGHGTVLVAAQALILFVFGLFFSLLGVVLMKKRLVQ